MYRRALNGLWAIHRIVAIAILTTAPTISGCSKPPETPPETPADSPLPTAKTPNPPPASTRSPALAAAKARVDALTKDAVAAVERIERAPPTQAELITLNATFSDTKRKLVTDPELARLGQALNPSERKRVATYTRAAYETLMTRLAAAGRSRRRVAVDPGLNAQHRPDTAAP